MIDLEMVLCFADEGSDLLTRWEAICIELEKAPTAEGFNDLFRVAHNLKGSSRSVGLEKFGNFVHHIEDGITVLKKDPSTLSKPVLMSLLKAQSLLQQWLTAVKTDPQFELSTEEFLKEFQAALKGGAAPEAQSEAPAAPPAQAEPPAEMPTSSLAPAAASIEAAAPSRPQASSPSQATTKAPSQSAPQSGPPKDETIRVSAQKLDQLLEMVGELSIHQSIIWHSREAMDQANAADRTVTHAVYLSRKLTKELYERALSLRMHPVQTVFQRLERSIKEIAIELGKEVDVELLGGEVELDKTVCERIIEPLTHMVRNSVDHGLETTEARQASGKPPRGKVRISAIQESSSVILQIEDDGRGLNEEKILAKARENGIWDGRAALTKQEIFALIFLPGFSTAEKVTSVSGRGVGMDVVMRTIESLSGKITIGSEPGKGTRFQIYLPTTLSIIDALIVTVDGSRYAVPVAAVEEIVNLEEWNARPQDRMIKMRERVLPLASLSQFVPGPKGREGELVSGILTRVGGQALVFAVNRVADPQQIVVRKLSSAMGSAFGLAGGTILSDGKPALILDVSAIARHYLNQFKSEEKAA